MKKMKLNDKGFSLIELFTVIAIVGIGATIAIPSFVQQFPRIRVSNASKEIGRYMQLARLKAVSTNKEHRVVFTNNAYPTPDSYIMQKRVGGVWSNVKGSIVLPIDANIYDVTFAGNAAEFNPNGSAGSSGAVRLQTKDTADRLYKVTIGVSDMAVGKVNVETGA